LPLAIRARSALQSRSAWRSCAIAMRSCGLNMRSSGWPTAPRAG